MIELPTTAIVSDKQLTVEKDEQHKFTLVSPPAYQRNGCLPRQIHHIGLPRRPCPAQVARLHSRQSHRRDYQFLMRLLPLDSRLTNYITYNTNIHPYFCRSPHLRAKQTDVRQSEKLITDPHCQLKPLCCFRRLFAGTPVHYLKVPENFQQRRVLGPE